jgi:hypothetical protein
MNEQGEFQLRQGLRSLPRERMPTRDLWPAIAAARPRRAARWLPLAMAASLAVLVLGGGLGMLGHGPSLPNDDTAATLVRLDREAEAMLSQYQSHVLAMPAAAMPAALQPAATRLDDEVAAVLDALAAHPDSRLLLKQLQFALERRMRLTQRVV